MTTKIKELDHIAINVKTLQPTLDWYMHNLGATVDYQDDTWAMLDIAGSKVALTLPAQHPNHIAFRVDDISYLGQNPLQHRDGSYYCYVNDPEGNIIELIFWSK
jgi:catechol 2,3-dioxygenase-like lactoylglutathione lyase family enzyme